MISPIRSSDPFNLSTVIGRAVPIAGVYHLKQKIQIILFRLQGNNAVSINE